MTTAMFLLAAMLACTVSEALALCLGPFAWAWPSLPIATVLALARSSRRPWFRGAAVGLGLVEGLSRPDGLLAIPLALLLVASTFRAGRALWARERWLATLIAGTTAALLVDVLALALGVPWPTRTGPELAGLVIGACGTSGLLILVEAFLLGSPRLRRRMDRV